MILCWASVASAQLPLSIPQIQGASHTSPYVGNSVQSSGVITSTTSNGFYFQDPTGDGDDTTSDGIFVFTSAFPSGLAVGDAVEVSGFVFEFLPGGGVTNLTTTQIQSSLPMISKTGTGTISPTLIGDTGRVQPKSIIDNDSFGTFDPMQDGIDFYESLEGMLVQIPNAVAVAPRNGFGEIWAIPDNGTSVTGFNSRGGITISPGDYNPERLQIDDSLGVGTPTAKMGDLLGDATGILGYNFGTYELNLTSPLTPISGGLTVEQSALVGGPNHLAVASYNVLNLDPFDSDTQFNGLASQIVHNLNAPDIIALQEIQDSSGPVDNGVTDGSDTYNKLIARIQSQGGPTYEFREIAPPVANVDGGEPGGNSRVGYLFNPDRVSVKDGSLNRHGDGVSAFNGSRKPLEITFLFNGQEITLINNHFTAKSGSSPLFGLPQPWINGGEGARNAQAAFVNALVDDILLANPDAKVLVLGDLNEFTFESPLEILAGGVDPVLFDLNQLLDPNERYSYVFEGNSQQLDHMFASSALLGIAQFDAVHVNSGFNSTPSDHDPILARFYFPVPEPSTFVLTASAAVFAQSLVRRRRRRAC